MKYKYKKVLNLAIAAAALLGTVILFALLKYSTWVSEYVFARGISRGVSFFFGSISDAFPFSFFEVMIYLIIIFLLISLAYQIIQGRKRRRARVLGSLTTVAVVLLSVAVTYMGAAYFSYYREPLAGHIPQYSEEVKNIDASRAVNYFINDWNELSANFQRDGNGSVIAPYPKEELFEKLAEEFKKLDGDAYFSKRTATPKTLTSSLVLSNFGILGISYLPTGEANINALIVPCDLPTSIAHELSHVKGVMREGDAELLAAYITLSSDDPYIRYSGYCNFYRDILKILTARQMSAAYESAIQKIAPAIIKELNYRYEYYNSFSKTLSIIGDMVNGIYLKLNGAENGTASYNVEEGEFAKLAFALYFEDHEPFTLVIFPVKPYYFKWKGMLPFPLPVK